MDKIPGVGHEFAAHPGTAEHYAFGAQGFRRQDSRQHVVVIGNDKISIGFLSVRETEKVHDKRGIRHFLLRPAVPDSQRIEKVDAMFARQPPRNASERVSQPNTVVSSQEHRATLAIATDPACI